jgi:hypothetical protein
VGAVRAVGRFLYDLIIGDDWKIAAAVATVLAVGGLIVTVESGEWLAPVLGGLLGAAFSVAIAVDVRSRGDR